MARFTLRINGRDHAVDAEPDTPLVWVLRDQLDLTGTKYACGIGECGACTVLADGQAARSCQWTVRDAAGQEITTIEGLGGETLHPLQRAWEAEQVPQCGYCQPGQLMTAADLLARKPHPSDAEIDAAMDGVICRCGTYQRIRAAVARAAREGGEP